MRLWCEFTTSCVRERDVLSMTDAVVEHLSLSYQVEVLYNQAIALSQGKWRGQLLIEMDRAKKVLQVKYWM